MTILPLNLKSHCHLDQEVSLAEALANFDKKFLRSQSTNPVEFINARQERKQLFKLLKEASDSSFVDLKTGKKFEPLLSLIDRFFMRENGKHLVLAEFCQNYDFIGSSESSKIYKLLSKANIEIESSGIKSASSDQLYLPEMILLTNQHVMRIRKKKKILSFPTIGINSSDYQYSKAIH